MGLYERVADLPLTVGGTDRTRRERDTSSDFTRVTTTFSLSGGGQTGRGEDVTYATPDHDALADAPADPFDLTGEWTFDGFSAALGDVDLFPTKEPEREDFRHYRRWALEAAGLDLALRQAEETLGSVLDRSADPVRFVVSTRLGDPPAADRVAALLDRYPGTEFKLDPTPEWDDDLVATLAETDAVRIADLKGHYAGTDVDQPPDPALYRRVLEGFPDAVVEDPALTDETRPLLEGNEGRVSWDAPITGVESVEALPFEPSWLNVKPSRFGSVESLFEMSEHAVDRGTSLYGGGQFELGVGRGQIQELASVFYPDGPNDVAPGAYNDPEVPDDAPTSPLHPPADEDRSGFGW